MVLVAYHLKEDQAPTDPSTLNPEVPPSLSQAIMRALARRPENRWQSASEFLHALEEV